MTQTPTLIHIIGLVGAGKSTATHYLSEKQQIPAVQTDSIHKSLFPNPDYSDKECTIVEKAFEQEILSYMKDKQSIIVEGYSTKQEKRDIVQRFCEEYGYRYLPVCIQTDESHLKQRIEKRFTDKHRDSDGDRNVYLKLKAMRSPLQENVIIIDNDGTQEEFFVKLDTLVVGEKLGSTVQKPRFIMVCGVSGSGKSTVSHFLSEQTGYDCIVGDQIRHTVLKIAHLPGEEQSSILEEYALNQLRQFAQEKKSLIVDAVFALASQRNVFISKAREYGYDVYIIRVINSDIALITKRIGERIPNDITQFSRGSIDDYQRTMKNRENINESHVTIENSGTVAELYAFIEKSVLPLLKKEPL